jgi:hypothetical protein
MVNPVIPAVIGLGGGVAIGYIVATTMGAGAKLPRIILSRYQVPVGQTYDLTCVNFPPNSQLVAPQSLYPPTIVNLGTTDSNGTLTLRGNVAQGPAGTYYIIAWNATDGKYCSMVTLIVT